MNKTDQFTELRNRMEKFLADRDWKNYHNPKNIAMSIAIESAELMELFQWHNKTPEKVMSDNELLLEIRDELADILIYTVSMGLCLDIDLFQSVLDKMEKNNIRFPPVKRD